MKEEIKYTNQQYKFICELLWGGVPIDKDWAIQTQIFIKSAPEILDKFPMLDKSFFKYKNYEIIKSK